MATGGRRTAARPRGARGWAGVAPALALCLALATGAQAQSGAPPIEELDRIVAVVNDDVIVMSELRERLLTVIEQLRRGGTPTPPAQVLEKQVLEQLVLDRLQLQLARRNGVRVGDDELNAAVTRIAAENQLSLREFRDILERDGYDFAKFRDNIRNQMLITGLQRRQVQNRIRVSERDIDNYLATAAKQGSARRDYHLAQILIEVPEAASPEQIAEARAEAEALRARVEAGEDFAGLAVAHSDGQQALEGGDLGWRAARALPTFFTDAVAGLEPGEVTPTLRSGSGFHLVKLIASRGDERHIVTQTRARHILIRVNELVTEADATGRLNQLLLRMEGGDDFAELARTHSDDTTSAVRGGDLGWLNPGDTIPAFEAQIDALAPGETSKPFRTEFGVHVVQVVDRRQHDDTEKARRAEARAQIRRRKLDEELQIWQRQLRDEAVVQYRLDE